MNVRKVEVSFVAKYHVDNWGIYGVSIPNCYL